jgi:hypothetical protein
VSNASPHEKKLFKIMVIGTALSFGFLGAIIFSMKDFVGGDAAFKFSYRTLLGFLGGTFLGWIFWAIVQRKIKRNDNHKKSGST